MTPAVYPSELLARVAVSAAAAPGDAHATRLLVESDPEELLDRLDHPGTPLWPECLDDALFGGGDARDLAADLLRVAAEHHARLIVPGDAEWPDRLDDLAGIDGAAPPLCLWVKGPHSLREVLASSAAVVGDRESTAYGRHVAAELGCGLAGAGVTVASRGAYGLDDNACRGALTAHGRAVAVVPCGIDRPWPLGGGGVCAVVAQTGVVVSAEPPGAAATLTRARQSLRLLASASAALVVVETVAGSQLTRAARVAAGTGRLVCAVPGPVTSAASSGCHQLLRDGAARAATCADDVLDDLATTTSRRACPDEAHAEADPSAPAEVRRS